ncbi:hypothetical protein K701_08665 [Streptomyces fradiae ATCC 10745 = DSM 40063]|uniref:Uncharacterized protein n=1 Tax=Streptomyces fradiae ATCC 10745 = DSM 40063 TaxID=1319510 RepID=A0ABQ6XWV7_STRFR|nr:hypothetical protein K701_08665 [Streptomyces fradiae ATCC 10745 = DSM 40063]
MERAERNGFAISSLRRFRANLRSSYVNALRILRFSNQVVVDRLTLVIKVLNSNAMQTQPVNGNFVGFTLKSILHTIYQRQGSHLKVGITKPIVV